MNEEISAEKTWELVDWCFHHGADEFTIELIGAKKGIESHKNEFDKIFKPYMLQSAIREVHTLRLGDKDWKKTVDLWALNERSIQQLKSVLKEGIFSYDVGSEVWLEDLTLYRDEKFFLGVITHEDMCLLRLKTEEMKSVSKMGFNLQTIK